MGDRGPPQALRDEDDDPEEEAQEEDEEELRGGDEADVEGREDERHVEERAPPTEHADPRPEEDPAEDELLDDARGDEHDDHRDQERLRPGIPRPEDRVRARRGHAGRGMQDLELEESQEEPYDRQAYVERDESPPADPQEHVPRVEPLGIHDRRRREKQGRSEE